MVSNRVLVWDKIALDHFQEVYEYLKIGRNLNYANKVKKTILKAGYPQG